MKATFFQPLWVNDSFRHSIAGGIFILNANEPGNRTSNLLLRQLPGTKRLRAGAAETLPGGLQTGESQDLL